MRRVGLGWAAIFTLACNGGAGSEASDTESGSATSTMTATATATTGEASETGGTESASGTNGTNGTDGTDGTDTEDTGVGCGSGTPWTAAEPGPFIISYDEEGLLLPYPSRPRPSEDGRYVLFTTLTQPGNLLAMWRLDNK